MGSGAGIGTGIIGGELQGWASELDKYSMQRVYGEEIARQNAYTNEARQTFHPENYSASALQQGVDAGAAAREAAYKSIGQVPTGADPSVASGYKPNVASAYTDMLGKARANLGGYSDWAVQQAISNMNTQRQLNQITNFAASQSQNVYPQQMYAAQHSNDTLAAAGQAISSIGGAAGNYAALSAPPQSPGTYGTLPTQAPGYYYVPTGPSSSSSFSGYGGYPPQGTGYNPYTDQSMAPSLGAQYGWGG